MKAENTLNLDRISAPKLIFPPWHKKQTDKVSFSLKKKKRNKEV